MHIGMIGAGTVSQSLARYLLPAGHTVLLSNSRGPESLSIRTKSEVPFHNGLIALQ